MQQQLQEVGRWIGSVFYGVIGHVLPYINGFVMAIKELISVFAMFVGFEMPNSSGSTGTILDDMTDSMDGFGSSVGDANSGLDGTKKKLKEIEGQLASFDKLNVIKPPSDNDTGGSGGGGGGGGMSIDPKLLDYLDKMNYKFNDIRMKANEIKEEILEWVDLVGKLANENIFEPIKNSWDKYGGSISANMKEMIDNSSYMWNELVDSIGKKWKPFFQEFSDLFFGLLDTGTLTLTTIQKFFISVWDNGGKYLFDSIWDLVTAFLKLANSINDNFVKPVINALKNTLVPVFGSSVGKILGLVGGVIDVFASLVSKIAENKTAVVLLASAFTAMFATVKIAKFVDLFTTLKNGLGTFGALESILLKNSKVFSNLWIVVQKGKESFNGTSSSLKVFNNILKDTKAGELYAKAMNAISGKFVEMGAKSTSLAGTLSTKLGGAFSWLASNPLVAVGVAITAVVAGFALYNATQSDTYYVTDETGKKIYKQAEAMDELLTKTTKSVKANKEQADNVRDYVDELERSIDSEGKVITNKERVNFLVKEINKLMPNSIQYTKDGRVQINGETEDLKNNIVVQEARLQLKTLEGAIEKAQADAKKALINLQIKHNQVMQMESLIEETNIKLKSADADQVEELTRKRDVYMNQLKGLQAEESTAADTYSKAQEVIRQTSNLSTAIQSGNVEAMKKALDELSISYDKDAKTYSTSIDEKIISKQKEYETLLDLQKSGNEQISQADLDARKAELDALKAHKAEIEEATVLSNLNLLEEEKGTNQKLTDDQVKTYKTLIEMMSTYGLEVNSKNTELYKTVLGIVEQSGYDISQESGQQYVKFLTDLTNHGVKVNAKKKEEYQNLYNAYKTHGSNMNAEQRTQYSQFLSLLASHNISINSETGKRYQREYLDAQSESTKSGSAYIKNLEKEIKDPSKKVENAAKNTGKSALKAFESNKAKFQVSTTEAEEKLKKATRNRTIWGQLVLSTAQKTLKIGTKGFDISMYANGGFPTVGQMFMARENGIPELVGTMGGRPAVANNDQIVAGIKSGVFDAVVSALSAIGGFGVPNVYVTNQNIVDGKVIKEEMKKVNEETQRKTGKPFFKKK